MFFVCWNLPLFSIELKFNFTFLVWYYLCFCSILLNHYDNNNLTFICHLYFFEQNYHFIFSSVICFCFLFPDSLYSNIPKTGLASQPVITQLCLYRTAPHAIIHTVAIFTERVTSCLHDELPIVDKVRI